MSIYLKYFPDLPEGDGFENTTRKGNIHISNNVGNVSYGPTSETGFYAGPIPRPDGYVLYTYELTTGQINSKPSLGSSPILPSKDGASWSRDIIPEARFFGDLTSLTKYYNNKYSTSLDGSGVLNGINNNNDLYLDTIITPTPTPTPSSRNGGSPPVGGGIG
jgi:hypothetical protein